MKKLLLSVAALTLIILAGVFFFFTDPNIIDEDYISSQKYRTLENNIEEDKAENKSQEWVLEQVALHLLNNSTQYQPTLPVRLDSVSIDSILSLSNEIASDDIDSQHEAFKEYSYHGILVLSEGGVESVVFVINSKGLYKKIDVILATVTDSSLVDFESIGSFQKNLSEETVSLIQIGESKAIKTKVVKERFYPVRQQNEVDYYYEVLPDGTIEAKLTKDR